MHSTDTNTSAKLESLKNASFRRLLDKAAQLQSSGQLKRLPLRPGQVPPPTRELRIKTSSSSLSRR